MAIHPTQAQNIFKSVENVDSKIKAQIKDHGGRIKDLESVKVSSISFNLMSGAANFDVINNAEFRLSTSNLAEKKIAWIDEVLNGLTTVEPQYTGDNLKDYLVDDNYIITISGVVAESFYDTIYVDLVVDYDVSL